MHGDVELSYRDYLLADIEITMAKAAFIHKFESFKREDLFVNKVKKNDLDDQIYLFFSTISKDDTNKLLLLQHEKQVVHPMLPYRGFKNLIFRGVDLSELIDMSLDD